MIRRGIREYLRLRPRNAAEVDAQVDEEIALHVELRTRELMSQGMAEEQARAEAERLFGDLAVTRRELQRRAERRERRASMAEWLDGWRQDFAYSARTVLREPLPALVVVLTLALGIGANATVFGIVDQLLLRGPAHVQSPEQVQRVYITERAFDGDLRTNAFTGYVTMSVMAELSDVFEEVAVYRYASQRVGLGAGAEPTPTGYATAAMFPLLGVQPAVGRFFTPEDDRPHAAQRVAVLEYGYWQSRFGGTADAIGRTLVIDGEEYSVIGVAPKRFSGPELRPAHLWLPFSTGYSPTEDWPNSWKVRWTNVLVRLRDDVMPAQADARATAAYRAAAAAAGQTSTDEVRVQFLSPGYSSAGAEPPEVAVARWLAAVAMIVLLVAGANVVNVLLSRAVRRRGELAVRLALGVSRGRLVRLLLSESLLLAFAGGVLALVIATAGGGFLRATLLPDVMWDPALSSRVLLFSGALVIVTGIVVGLAPALGATRQDVGSIMRQSSTRASAGRGRLRPALTVLQTAFALVLLVGGAHFVRSLWNVHRMDLGIDADRVLLAWTQFQSADAMGEEERAAFEQRRRTFTQDAVERLRVRPDVAAATVASSVPMSGATMSQTIRVPGYDSLPRLPGGGPYATGVGDGYFETVGTRIVRGRGIEARDTPDSERVIVVSETMARTLWPGRDAIGECVYLGGDDAPCSRIVGVAADARRRALVEKPAMHYYVPFGQGMRGSGEVLVRPARNTAAFMPELRAALHAMEPAIAHVDVRPLHQTLDTEMRPWRLGATMFMVFGGLALAIAAIGLYSVIAYAVTQRRHELGVRMALGARARDVAAMIMREGVLLVLLGIVIGIPVALLAGRRIEALLFQTQATDATTFAAVAAVLLCIGVVATLVPALRAARTDPLQAVRGD